MSEVLLPMMEAEWKKPPPERAQSSLAMPIEIIEGEILVYLEERGPTPLRRLVKELFWAAPLVTRAVDSLIGEGLVRAIRHDLEIIVKLQPEGGVRVVRIPDGRGF